MRAVIVSERDEICELTAANWRDDGENTKRAEATKARKWRDERAQLVESLFTAAHSRKKQSAASSPSLVLGNDR